MKKILIALLIVILTTGLLATTAAAAVVGVLDYSVSSTRINMTEAGTGSFDITVPGSAAPYAGVEFEIQLPSGVTISSVSYSLTDAAENLPMTPPGGQKPDTVYFSCYALENKFTAALTCTVSVVYEGSVETALVIKEIKQYTKIGEKPDDPVHTTEDRVSDKEIRVALVPFGGGTSASSTDATLFSLTVSPGTLTPAFDPNTTSYTSSVANGVSGVTVTAVANHAGAKVAGAGALSLAVGVNRLTVTVTAEDNVTKKEYVITITRGSSGGSSVVSGTEDVGDNTAPLASLFPFTDVAESDWFYGDVYYMWENELMNGMSVTLFSPDRTLTRGMVVTVLYRMEGRPDVSELGNPFPDVAAGEYYTDAVIWAAAEKIVLGYPNGKFGPNENVTREQLATIIHRYENALKKIPENTAETRDFTDKDKISGYAQESVNALVLQDIIRGRSNDAFDPQGTATRAEFAAMLHRFLVAVKQ
ncbi:MAG: S-layer homology domain-containing protein [Oscillospiraceae bacterium]|jgi:hypothetical protein|nr:S-layer homology domain-containing protein [Oscillospiraceae bacterium]